MRALVAALLLAALATGAQADPANFNEAVTRANVAIGAGRFADAENQIGVAAKLQPKAAEIPNLRGVLRTRQGRLDEAAEEYNRALALNPKFYPAKFNLAELALTRRDYPEALARYRELQTVDPRSEVLRFKEALCLVLSGDDAKAKAVTDTIPFPGDTPAYYYARAAACLKASNLPQVDYYRNTAHKYYGDERCTYFETALRAVGMDVAREKKSEDKGQK